MTAVCIATYNNEPYIAQAIESVLAQVCDEPLRIYIGDDASTDGTAAICEQYAEQDNRIVYIRRKQNLGLTDNTIDLYRHIMADGCEYIAMLDGDDYWIASDKLQEQINCLRLHPETGFVHTAAYDETDGKRVDADEADKPVGDVRLRYNLYGVKHTNCTVLFRTELLRQINLDELEQQHFTILDYPLYGLFSQLTQFGYIYRYTAVWRNHTSVSHPLRLADYRRYKKERIRMWKWLDEHYPKHFHFSQIQAILWLSGQLFAFFREKMQ